MKLVHVAAATLAFAALASTAYAADPVEGTWLVQAGTAKVRVAPCGGDKAKAADGKQRDIARMLSLYRKGVATIIAGDFNTSDTAALARTGLVRATPAEDTLDKAGVQPLDQVWVTPDLIVRGATLLDPGSLTDHKTWVVNLTLDGGLTPPIPASI